MKENAILTFDYEVFLGRKTGTIENCIIKPTKLILEILRENNAKAIFFVDATWLLFLKETYIHDFLYITEQLKEISKSGSSVELHMHPQWIQAKKTDKGIIFESWENYKLHSLGNQRFLIYLKNLLNYWKIFQIRKYIALELADGVLNPFIRLKMHL
jgi:hypothetical protein